MQTKTETSPTASNIPVITFEVKETSELMKFLIANLKGKSRENIKSLLAHHQVAVDGKMTTQFNHPLEIGQTVSISKVRVSKLNSDYQKLNIIFEDAHIIVIEKREGLLSMATEKEKEQTAYSLLSEYIKKKNPNNLIFIVHRLDRETSGLMMFAKSLVVQQKLQEAWKEVVVERNYVVVVEGQVEKNEGTITSWLKENKALTMYSSPTENDGQKSITHYKVLKRNKKYSLLDIKLETGRKNQIRVHMKEIGHSVIGDKKYGGDKSPIGRLGLHARILAFVHPITGEPLRFETPIPKKFMELF